MNDIANLPANYQADVPLTELARIAREAHVATGEAVNNAMQHALTAGRALIAAKKKVSEGRWTKWIHDNCDFSDRHARRYIALVQAYEAAGHACPADVLGLSLRKAIKHLTPSTKRAAPARARTSAPVRATTAIDLAEVWVRAPLPERQRFLDNTGRAAFFQAFPASWLPVESWSQQGQLSSPATIPESELDEDGYPNLPACLRRVH
jgi:hypothetical protein